MPSRTKPMTTSTWRTTFDSKPNLKRRKPHSKKMRGPRLNQSRKTIGHLRTTMMRVKMIKHIKLSLKSTTEEVPIRESSTLLEPRGGRPNGTVGSDLVVILLSYINHLKYPLLGLNIRSGCDNLCADRLGRGAPPKMLKLLIVLKVFERFPDFYYANAVVCCEESMKDFEKNSVVGVGRW